VVRPLSRRKFAPTPVPQAFIFTMSAGLAVSHLVIEVRQLGRPQNKKTPRDTGLGCPYKGNGSSLPPASH
jgi:hypothetical protein